MTFRSSFSLALVGASLWACVSQYTSPGGEVENTSTEPAPSSSDEVNEETTRSSDETSSSKESDDSSSDEPTRAPTETSGACDDRSCVSTTDCCKGYQCGFDPERSKVTRYCLPQ